MKFTEVVEKYTLASEVDEWCKEQYKEKFSQYFEVVEDLYSKMSSEYKPITDSDLEKILTTLPLQLFVVSEELNSLKLKVEVIKLEIQKNKLESKSTSDDSGIFEDSKVSAIESKLVLKAYESIIETVSRQMTYSRELIMSAKKVWAARKESADGLVQTSGAESIDDLPEYKVSM